MKDWGKEEYEKAICNYERLLQERPEDQDLLEKFQLICLEYARFLNREREVVNSVDIFQEKN